MERYLNDYHRKRSLAALKEVEYMLKHPLSRKEALAQRDRLIDMRPEIKLNIHKI